MSYDSDSKYSSLNLMNAYSTNDFSLDNLHIEMGSLNKWVTSFRGKACGSSSESALELIIDALLHKDTRTSHTRLTFIIIEFIMMLERLLVEYTPMLELIKIIKINDARH